MDNSKRLLIISSKSEETILVKKYIYTQQILADIDSQKELKSLSFNRNTSKSLSISDTILAIRDFKRKNT